MKLGYEEMIDKILIDGHSHYQVAFDDVLQAVACLQIGFPNCTIVNDVRPKLSFRSNPFVNLYQELAPSEAFLISIGDFHPKVCIRWRMISLILC